MEREILRQDSNVGFCELCQENVPTIYCQSCQRCLCSSCSKVHVQFLPCKQKKQKPIKELIQELHQEINELLQEFNTRKESLEAERDNRIQQYFGHVEQVKSKLLTEQQIIMNRVEKHFETCLAQVDNMASMYGERMTQAYQDEVGKYDQYTACVEERKRSQIKALTGDTRSFLASLRTKIDMYQTLIAPPPMFTLINEDIKTAALDLTKALNVSNNMIEDSENSCAVTNCEFKIISSFALPAHAHSILKIRQHLWCLHEDCITVHDKNGSQVTTSSSRFSGGCGLTALRNSVIIVASTTTGLLVFNQNCKMMGVLCAGVFLDVRSAGDQLYALQIMKDNKVSIIQYKLLPQGKFSRLLRAETDWQWDGKGLSFFPFQSTFLLCSWSQPRAFQIDAFGQVIKTFGKAGAKAAGELHGPFICNVDQNGFALIADQYNHRLQMLDISGDRWTCVGLSKMIHYPKCATTAQKYMYILSGYYPAPTRVYICKAV